MLHLIPSLSRLLMGLVAISSSAAVVMLDVSDKIPKLHPKAMGVTTLAAWLHAIGVKSVKRGF